jgi:hypothetical protein
VNIIFTALGKHNRLANYFGKFARTALIYQGGTGFLYENKL